MSDTLYCFNRYHYGDCLQSLHLLRVFAKQVRSRPIVFFTNGHQISQLKEVVEDLPNILIEPFESSLWRDHERDAVDMWKNAEGFWEASRYRWDWSSFMLEHHAWTARRMGQHSPFTCREHLLLDYPALEIHGEGIRMPRARGEWKWTHGFLVGNSAPSSGQYKEWADHSHAPLEPLIQALKEQHSVLTTSDLQSNPSTISYSGKISALCRHHIMVANGPFFTTLNVHNHHDHERRRRIVLLDNGENLNMPHVDQVSRVEQLFAIAKQEGWL